MYAIAKLTAKNQLTLPVAVVRRFPGVVHFLITTDESRVILEPARIQRADAVRAKLRRMGLGEDVVGEAVTWARRTRA